MSEQQTIACHCRRVRIAVRAPIDRVTECNYSTCGKSGFLSWKVAASTTTLLTEKAGLSTYIWHDVEGGLHFCPICGVSMIRTGYPDGIVSLNARALVGVDVFTLPIVRYDGRNDMPPGPSDL